MKIIARYQNRCLTLGYIRATNNTIVSWYMPTFLNLYFAGEDVENRDFHITYPKDGNAHASYKYFNPIDNCNYEKRIYFDEVVIKQFDHEKKFLNFSKQGRDVNDLDQHMVILIKPMPLNHVPLFYDFPQAAYPIEERFLNKIITPCTNIGNDDIVLDLDAHPGRFINAGFYIYDNTHTDYIREEDVLTIRKRISVINDSVFVEGFILVTS